MSTSYIYIYICMYVYFMFLFQENVSNTMYKSVLEWKMTMNTFIKHGDSPFIFEDDFNFVSVEFLLAFVYILERVLKLLFLKMTTFLKNIKKWYELLWGVFSMQHYVILCFSALFLNVLNFNNAIKNTKSIKLHVHTERTF